MQQMICSRCKKNVAVVFITKIENSVSVNEGICLKCAKELGIKPINDIMDRMGLSEEDIDTISGEMMGAFAGFSESTEPSDESPDAPIDETPGTTATFPFLDKLLGGSGLSMSLSSDGPPSERRQKEHTEKDTKKSASESRPKRKFLDAYCISLTQKAEENKLDRVIGREAEIGRVVQILNRRQKNNPCLIGEPGVGKTAIAEGLAQAIYDGRVPSKLRDKEVLLLDLTSVVAGTQFRGQFESRMKGIIDEIKKAGNIILVIDEVHNIVGAGDAEGSLNAGDIMKPALSRGEIQVIGATTFTEYRKHIEKDTALERRFQPVTVEEPSVDDCVAIIRGIRGYYEEYHGVKINDYVARQAVLLSERYITDRFLPDKAIDLIDEACSHVNLSNPDIAEKERLKGELSGMYVEREALMNNTDEESYGKIAHLRELQCRVENRIAELENSPPTLTVDDLSHVIELWTRIPASRVREEEFERIVQLDARLMNRIIGQDEAVRLTANAIRRNRAGISPKHKPVSLIFAGPTGVGKTELVKQLAADMFDTPEALIRLDMSEFMEKHSVSRIIGAPPGYVGYDEAGQLTEKVRRKPYCVILFDEIEKAHPDVLNVMLQILDDGQVTDAHGRKVSFENTVIVMTTNAGSDKKSATAGFARSVSEQSKEKIMKALSDFLRPEFLNRVDEVICFNHLSEENFKKVAAIMLSDLLKTLTEQGIEANYDDKLIDYLCVKSYSLTYGARNLRRLIQKEVEDEVANLIISSYENPVSALSISVDNGKIIVRRQN